jgi:hypothetical protein
MWKQVLASPQSTSLRRGDVWQLLPAAVQTLVGRSVFDGARYGENAVDAMEYHAFHEVQPTIHVGVKGRASGAGSSGVAKCELWYKPASALAPPT